MSILSSGSNRTWVSPIVAVTFAIVSVTGIFMLLHIQTPAMNSLHEWIGLLFVAAGLIHLLLNWKALLSCLKKKAGVVAAALALLLGVVLYILPAGLSGRAQGEDRPSGNAPPIVLPQPQTAAGMPLMQALAHRRTARAFQDKPLPPQALSNLLWAAFGVNRSRKEMPGLGRTAPSARNRQEIELYVVLSQGVYVYDAEANSLRPLLAGDLRPKVGEGEAAHAAATLLFVADEAKSKFAQVDTGFIGQNVYLFAASEGLNAWFYTIHAQEVTRALNLPAGKTPLYAQSVGYPPQ